MTARPGRAGGDRRADPGHGARGRRDRRRLPLGRRAHPLRAGPRHRPRPPDLLATRPAWRLTPCCSRSTSATPTPCSALFDGRHSWSQSWRIKTDARDTADELALMFRGLLAGDARDHRGRRCARPCRRCCASCAAMLARYYADVPTVDRRAGRHAPACRCSSTTPRRSAPTGSSTRSRRTTSTAGRAIVVDFGTSTNFDVVSAQGEFLGGALAPGIEISLRRAGGPGRPAAQGRAGPAALGDRQEHGRGLQSGRPVRLRRPGRPVWSRRIDRGAGRGRRAVIATGGLAPVVIDECRTITAPRARPHADRPAAGLRAQHLTRLAAVARCAGAAAAGSAAQRVALHRGHVRQVEVLPADQLRVGPGQLPDPAEQRLPLRRRHPDRVAAGADQLGQAVRVQLLLVPELGERLRLERPRSPAGPARRCAPAWFRWSPISPASARTQATDSSREFQSSASRPPGRSTRAISGSARSRSNQWNAWPTATASTAASGSGSCLGAAGQRRGPGRRCARAPRASRASGSTAIVVTPAAHSAGSACRCRRRGPAPAGPAGPAAAAGRTRPPPVGSRGGARSYSTAISASVQAVRPVRSISTSGTERYPRAGQVRPIGSAAVTQAPDRGNDPGRDPTTSRTTPSRCGSAGRSGTGCWRRAPSPTRSTVPRTATLAEVRRALPRPAAGHRDRRPGRRHRPGDLPAQHRQALLRHAARAATAPSCRRCSRWTGSARRRWRPGRPTSTSATTCSSPAR